MSGTKISIKQRIWLEQYRTLHKKHVADHTLNTLFWECTLRCNLACKHCGSDCRVDSSVQELSGEEFLTVVDGITPYVDPNKVLVIFTGGEALVRPDLEEVGLQLYRRGYPWGVVTNGMLLNESRLERLLRGGLHALTISLDGFEEAHNYLRGHPLSFQRASHAVELMTKTEQVRWDVVTCVNPMNFCYLKEFRDYLIDLGLKEWRIFTIFPVGRAAEDLNLQLSDEDFYRLMEFIRDTNQEGRIEVSYGCEGFLGGFEGEVRNHPYTCYAGVSVASILCDGTISACPSIRFDHKQGNIRQDDFWTVWQSKFQHYRNRDWARKEQCSDCLVWRYCEGNGMHLHDDDGHLLFCHYRRLLRAEKSLGK